MTKRTQSRQSSISSVLTLRMHSSIRSDRNPSCSRIPNKVATLATTLSCGS